MAGPNQSGIHEAIRTQISQRFGYGEDWSALFDQDGIPQGDWNGRLLNWINFKLGTSYSSYPAALQAFAESQGFRNWASMNTVVFDYVYQNAEAEAVAAAMTTPPTNSRAALIDTFVGSLKTAGIWADLDIMYVLAAADSQAARLNWKNPGTFTLVNVGAGPSFAADLGFTGNGSSTALKTGYTPSVNGVKFIQDNASCWIWPRTDAQEDIRCIGNQGGNAISMMPRTTANTFAANANDSSNVSVGSSNNSTGLFGISRAASGTKVGWRNGVTIGNASVASSGVAGQEQWICGGNSSSFSARQYSFAAWGASLSGKEAAFYNAVLAYMQGVGAA